MMEARIIRVYMAGSFKNMLFELGFSILTIGRTQAAIRIVFDRAPIIKILLSPILITI